jgi:hypothetical protein
MTLRQIAYGLVLAVTGLPACAAPFPCDDGQELRRGFCYPADAAVSGPAKLDAGEPVEPSEAFGQSCTSSSQCISPATYCAIQPGQTSGFCTAFGCDQDPSLCPATWSCMDLTSYGLAAHMCVPGS